MKNKLCIITMVIALSASVVLAGEKAIYEYDEETLGYYLAGFHNGSIDSSVTPEPSATLEQTLAYWDGYLNGLSLSGRVPKGISGPGGGDGGGDPPEDLADDIDISDIPVVTPDGEYLGTFKGRCPDPS